MGFKIFLLILRLFFQQEFTTVDLFLIDCTEKFSIFMFESF